MSSRGRGSSIQLETSERSTFQTPRTEHFPSTDENSLLDEARGVNQQLKPADRGAAAWKVLFAAFVFEALLWGKLRNCHMLYPSVDISLNSSSSGFPISFGVFQNYYEKLPEFKDNPHITIVGTMASGVPYLGAPFMAAFVRRYQRYRTLMICLGWPLCIGALVAGSFASTVGLLIMTQGIMYGGELITHKIR